MGDAGLADFAACTRAEACYLAAGWLLFVLLPWFLPDAPKAMQPMVKLSAIAAVFVTRRFMEVSLLQCSIMVPR